MASSRSSIYVLSTLRCALFFIRPRAVLSEIGASTSQPTAEAVLLGNSQSQPNQLIREKKHCVRLPTMLGQFFCEMCENKSAHQLLACAHFAYFPICPGTLTIFALSLMQRQMRLQISRVKNIGGVFELSGWCFALPRRGLGFFLFKFSKR